MLLWWFVLFVVCIVLNMLIFFVFVCYLWFVFIVFLWFGFMLFGGLVVYFGYFCVEFVMWCGWFMECIYVDLVGLC